MFKSGRFSILLAATKAAILITFLAYPPLSSGKISSPSAQIKIKPLIFLPRDVSLSEFELAVAKQRFQKHMILAQNTYQQLLGQSFELDSQNIEIFYGEQTNNFYRSKIGTRRGSSVEWFTQELFHFYRETRLDSKRIYVLLYVRPANEKQLFQTKIFASGLTFNGPPNSGGGIIELEYRAMMRDIPYPFQSALVHELGHSFGLAHVDCYGLNQYHNGSVMSYNPDHWTRGLSQGRRQASLNPHERFLLAQNQKVFPGLTYTGAFGAPRFHTISDVQSCYQTAMTDAIGPVEPVTGRGFEMFINNARVTGKDSQFFTREQALKQCFGNLKNNAHLRVACRYDDELFYSNYLPDFLPEKNGRSREAKHSVSANTGY